MALEATQLCALPSCPRYRKGQQDWEGLCAPQLREDLIIDELMSLSEDSDSLSNSDIQIFMHMMDTLYDLHINDPNFDIMLNLIFDLYIRILHLLKLSFLDLSPLTRTMVNWDYCVHVSNFDDLQDQDLMFFDPGL